MLGAVALTAVMAQGAAATAQSLPPISANAYIMERLLAAAIGDAIRDNCPRIEERTWVVRSEALQLYNHARGLGYDHATIDRFLRDRAERRAVYAQRDAWLASNGVVAGDAESYCRVGRAEIAANSLTGKLLRFR
jgi:uncharacterized protein (UPF0335 family)